MQVTRSRSHSKDGTLPGCEPQGVRIVCRMPTAFSHLSKVEKNPSVQLGLNPTYSRLPECWPHPPSAQQYLLTLTCAPKKRKSHAQACFWNYLVNRLCFQSMNPQLKIHSTTVFFGLCDILDGIEKYGNGCTFTVHSHFQAPTVYC